MPCPTTPPSPPPTRPPPKEAAWRLDISERTLRRIRQSGEIEYVRVGGRIKYTPAAIDAYIGKNTVVERTRRRTSKRWRRA